VAWPLNEKQSNLIEREGMYNGCYKHYETPQWEKIVKKYGKTNTPEMHDKIVEEALIGLISEKILDMRLFLHLSFFILKAKPSL
jgi:hypothetical protein